MMTLSEKIEHERAAAEANRKVAEFEPIDDVDSCIVANCIKIAEEHEQLADWLEELSRRRVDELFRKTDEKAIRDKAIDDVLEILKRYNVPFNCDANYEILQLKECGSNV